MRFFWQIEPKICDKIAFKHEQGLRTPLVARGVQARVIEKLGSEVGKIWVINRNVLMYVLKVLKKFLHLF